MTQPAPPDQPPVQPQDPHAHDAPEQTPEEVEDTNEVAGWLAAAASVYAGYQAAEASHAAIAALLAKRYRLDIRQVLILVRTTAAQPEQAVIPLSPAVRQAYGDGPSRRAAYLMNAAKRLAKSAPSGQLPDQFAKERRYFNQHRAARQKRMQHAVTLDGMARSYGELLGWFAVLDDARTTPECLAAHGKNFYATHRPAIGFPGELHGGNCRCRPGPPHNTNRLVDPAARPRQLIAASSDADSIELAAPGQRYTHGWVKIDKPGPEHEGAAGQYTGGESLHVNKTLREGYGPLGMKKSDREMVQKLDAAFENAAPLSQAATLYRVIPTSSFRGDPLDLVGKPLTDKGFMSATQNPAFEPDWTPQPYLRVALQVPAGVKALDVSDVSYYPEQGEVLLPRGLKYQFDSVTPDPSTRFSSNPVYNATAHVVADGIELAFDEKLHPRGPDGRWWHGTASGDLRGGAYGLHVGTRQAATEALTATIGHPVDGHWDGTREYGKTLLAGKATLRKRGIYPTGYNMHAPDHDYYPTGDTKFINGDPVPMHARPDIIPFQIVGPMTNTPDRPYSDTKANALMKGQRTRGTGKSGYYYTNTGEDVGSVSAVVPNQNHLRRSGPVATPPKVGAGGTIQASRQDQAIELAALLQGTAAYLARRPITTSREDDMTTFEWVMTADQHAAYRRVIELADPKKTSTGQTLEKDGLTYDPKTKSFHPTTDAEKKDGKDFNSKHPRATAGTSGGTGGQFVPLGQGRDSDAQAVQDAAKNNPEATQDYKDALAGKADLSKMTPDRLEALSKLLYSFKSSDPTVVKARIAAAGELRKRGLDVNKVGGGIAGRTAVWKPGSKAPGGAAPAAKKAAGSSGGVDANNISDARRDQLFAAGWHGDPNDGQERLYPPGHKMLPQKAAPKPPQKAASRPAGSVPGRADHRTGSAQLSRDDQVAARVIELAFRFRHGWIKIGADQSGPNTKVPTGSLGTTGRVATPPKVGPPTKKVPTKALATAASALIRESLADPKDKRKRYLANRAAKALLDARGVSNAR